MVMRLFYWSDRARCFGNGFDRGAAALDYPTRPVRWVVGFAPGGANDILARMIGQRLSERLGQQFVIENKPGAGGNIGAEVGDQRRA